MVKIQVLFKAFECFSSTFQGKFYFQGFFKTVLYIQVLFKPVQTLENKQKINYLTTMVNVLKFRTLFFFIFSNKMLAFRAGIHKANREDPDQTVSLIWVCTVCLGF